MKYSTEFKIVQNSISKLNPEFSLCDILVAYHGKNRNKSAISKEVFEKELFSIYGVPIIGEWIRLEEDQNVETWGSHGGKLLIDDSGIKYEQTTKPFGFVTKDAQENASWVIITEKDGHTQNEYLLLKGCILWNSRYEECNTILEKNYGQSMEISHVDGDYDDGGCFNISDFVFSALCILGDHCPPCFESASVGSHKEFSQFKQEFTLMMQEYKKFNLDNPNSNIDSEDNSDTPIPTVEKNNQKKEDENLENTILFSDVCAKIKESFAQYTYRADTGTQFEKFDVIAIHEDSKTVDVVDREDKYSVYTIPYIATKTDEDLVVSIDNDNKVEKSFVIGDKSDVVFDIKTEVDMISKDTSDYNVENFSTKGELTAKLADAESKYAVAQTEISTLKAQLAIFENEKKEFMAQKHKDVIDAVIAGKRAEMGKYSEFLEYHATIDYSKSVEQIEADLKEIHYKFMLKSKGGKNEFSYTETSVPTEGDNPIAQRYGEDVAKYFQNK